MTTITAYQLSELLRKVNPHVGRHSGYAVIQGIHLDYDGRHLHAVATDRYTIAVARQTAPGEGSWTATINGSDRGNHLDGVIAWLASHQGEDAITVEPDLGPGYNLNLASTRSTLTVPVDGGEFPDWRGLIRTAVDRDGTDSPWTGHTSKLLARWETAGHDICTWQSSFDKPMVITASGFIGLQMPRRIADEESPAARHDEWADSLGSGNPVEMDDTLNTWEPQELDERDNVIGQYAEELLQMTLRYTGRSPATEEPVARTGHYLAAIHGWYAYQLLKALEKADPDLLRTVLADTHEQADSGEIGEWAWDEAEKAGHDPEAWRDEYEAHLKKLAADKGTAA